MCLDRYLSIILKCLEVKKILEENNNVDINKIRIIYLLMSLSLVK